MSLLSPETDRRCPVHLVFHNRLILWDICSSSCLGKTRC
jgi:hypothetical protein